MGRGQHHERCKQGLRGVVNTATSELVAVLVQRLVSLGAWFGQCERLPGGKVVWPADREEEDDKGEEDGGWGRWVMVA